MDPAAPTPPSSPRSPAPLPAEFKDRRTGLQIFGAFTIVLGVLFALLIPMMILGQTLNAKATGTPVRFRELFFLIVLYGGMATALVWVGIGSCLIRRWARALLLMGSASGLVIGAGSMVVLAFVLPQFGALIKSAQPAGAPPLAEAAQTVAMILIGGMVFVIYVVLPGVWFLFYRSPHVKATCEAHDPVPRWTDACPLPVLTVSLWLALGVPMLLLMPVITACCPASACSFPAGQARWAIWSSPRSGPGARGPFTGWTCAVGGCWSSPSACCRSRTC